MKKITLLLFALGFTSFISAQCLTSVNGQYPSGSYDPSVSGTCDGLTVNSITTCGFGSEYSVVTVVSGQPYTFSSSFATDLITISADNGATAAIYGVGSVSWTATISGDVRFYTHLNDGACGADSTCRDRGVICGTPPSCIAPTAVTISNVTTTSATVSWTASTTTPANGYEYYYNTTNTAPTSTTVASGSVAAGVTTFNLSTLNTATSYYVWIRSVCSTSDSSAWTSVTTFTTLCTAVTDFVENFDAAVDFPACWAKVGTGGSSYVQPSTGTTSAPNNLYIYGTSTSSRAVVSMRPVSNAGDGTHQLRFRARGNYTAGDAIQVGYLTNPADDNSFVLLQSFTTTSITVFNVFTVIPGTSPGSNQILAFRHAGLLGNSILVDDVNWETIPTCTEPTAVNASNITTTSATISWTASASVPANGYQYYYATSSTAPTASTTPSGSVGAGVTTVNLTSLMDSSTYYVWVRSVCSSSDISSWSLSSTFITPCVPVSTFPWSENFDSLTTVGASIIPNCWSTVTGTSPWTSGNAASTSFNLPKSAPNYMRIAYSNTIASALWTPGFSMTPGQTYTLSFYYNTNGTTSSYIGFTGNILVNSSASATGATDLGTFITSTQGTTVYTQYTVTYTPLTAGTYYFALNVSSTGAPWYLGIDDVSVTSAALSNASFNDAGFTYFPNPVKDVLNISYTQNISKVAIYNIIGQEVIAKAINNNQSQIDMSGLSKGTYLVRVTADGATKTMKVIKE